MLFYKFMNMDLFKQGQDINEYMKEKFGLTLPNNLFNDDKVNFLYDYLCDKVEEHTCDKIDIIMDKFLFSDETEKEQIERVINRVDDIISEPKNYLGDLYAAIYMGFLYNMEGEDSFAYMGEDKKLEGETEAQYQLRKKVNNKKASYKDEMISVWVSIDDKINRDIVRQKYPVPVKVEISEADEKGIITSIPGGCFDYHKTMISKRNIGIFETTIEEGSFQRYSFMKNHEIYADLKDSSIENLLFMEYTLGIGYTNQMFDYLKSIRKYSDIQGFYPVIRAGAEITCFFLRKKIIEVIWEYIKLDLFNNKYSHNAVTLTNMANKIVAAIMEQVLEVWWYSYLEKGTNQELYILKLQVEVYWKEYFDEEIAYQEWMKICKIQDWRDIQNVEDVFARVDDVTRQEGFDWFYKTWPLQLSDINGNVKILDVGKSIHAIGEIVIKRTEDRLKQIEFPESIEQLYLMFDNIKREEFEGFKQEEKNKYNDINIIIDHTMKKVKENHVYALINHQVIDKCLEKVKSV